MVLQTRIPPFTHWQRPGSAGPDGRAHGIAQERQARKYVVGRKLTETVPLSRRRIVSYRTSKKANTTTRDKTKKPNRAIRDIKYARKLAGLVHT